MAWLAVLLFVGAVGASLSLLPEPSFESAKILGVEEAVRVALTRSRDIEDARLTLRITEGQVREAWSEVFPKIDLAGSYTRNITPQSLFLPATIAEPDAEPGELSRVRLGSDNVWSTQISIEQPLFQAQAFIGVGAAGRFRTLQEEILRGREQVVATRVRILYYDLLLREEQARLTGSSLRRVAETLAETRALHRAGIATDYDVLRLEVEHANLLPGLRRAENAFTKARRDLAVELDLNGIETLIPAGSLAELDIEHPEANTPENRALLQFTGIDLAGSTRELLLGNLLSGSSELRQRDQMIRLRRTDLRLHQAEFLPQLSLFGNYSMVAQQDGSPVFFGEGGSQRAYARAVGVSLTIPIFSGFQRTARVAQKRLELRRAETDHRLSWSRAEAQLDSLLEQLEEAELHVRGQRFTVDTAHRGFEIARSQYREGLGSRLELTDAEVALRQSEFNYAEAVYDWLTARARLDEAVGAVPLVDLH